MPLKKALTKTLNRLEGTAYYKRGLDYFQQGHVQSLQEDGDNITACVQGSHRSHVQLWMEGSQLQHECNCPLGEDSEFCKHCIAVSLAWLSQCGDTKALSSTKGNNSNQTIRNYLVSLESTALVELLLQTCQRDKLWREKLLQKALAQGDTGAAIKAWKNSLHRATTTRGFIDYYDMPSFAHGIEEIIDTLNDWISDGRAAHVIDLVEYAVTQVEKLIGECDDSNGELVNIMTYLGQLHLTACKTAPPNPIELAERLFQRELTDEWETFFAAAQRYADILGMPGLQHYRQLAETEWAKIPALAPGDNEPWNSVRFRITHMMESITHATGDVEALVAIKSRDLSSAFHFLSIAEIYQTKKQPDKALEWAERGLAAFPKATDNRLREFLIEAYLKRKRYDEAIALAWAQFTENVSLDNYKKLIRVATQAKLAKDWRDKALTEVRKNIATRFAQQRSYSFAPAAKPDQSLLVEIFLWEKNIDAAWQEAKIGVCHESLWLKMANLRAADHPQDALAVYRQQVTRLVSKTDNTSYQEATTLMRKDLIPLLEKCEGKSAVGHYLAELRVNFKAKRNSIKLLDDLN